MRLVLLFIMCFSLFACAVSPRSVIKPSVPKNTVSPRAEQPLLDIDSGGHKAKIKDIAFTPDGRSLVSAGYDKVIRVWDIASGQTVRTLRGQSEEGDEGKIYAMALSPNGQWLAVGGWMAGSTLEERHSIRLYDFNTGEVVAVLPGHENVVLSLAFSPDNRYLVSGSSGDFTAIVWDVAQRQLLHRLTGHTDDIYAVAFTSDSQRVVTGSFDHDLRLWSVQGQLLQTLTGHKDKVYAVAVSPQYIASGSWDNTIRLWHSKTGKFIKELANQGTHIGSLSFSPDGQHLVSGVGEGNNYHCHVWSVPEGKEISTYQGHNDIVLATAVSPDGQWVATGGGSNQEIHLWSLREGKLNQRLTGGGAATWAVGFSADGQQLAWGNQELTQPNQAGKLEYQLTLPTPERPLGEPQPLKSDKNFVRAQPQSQERVLRTRVGGNYGYQAILEVYQAQQVTARIERDATDGVDHQAYTFTPDGKFIISGGDNGVLTQYDIKGQKLGDYVGHTGDIWAVAVSPDGQLLASGSHDQTVRLWSVATRENLLTLFRSHDGEWVAWTPSGYYTASAQGDNMVGWQINHGADKAADYVTAAQLRQHFYRPDIVTNTVRLRNEQLALNQAQLQPFQLSQLNQALPPKFQIITPENEKHTKISQLPMKLSFAANAEPIQAVEIYSNDRLVLTRKIALPELRNSVPQEYTVPLYQTGWNQLRVVAKNRIGETVEQIKVYLDEYNAVANIGNLHLVAIGVSQYREQKYSLKYAAADAQALVEQLQQQQGKLYKAVHTTLLADGATLPTAANIRTALKNLTQAQPNDTVILFLAGHGINDNGNYFFLPHDVETRRLQNTAIPWLELQEALQSTQGKRILLVDTCHSGNAFNPRLVKDTADSRITLISATDENSVASESAGLNHGVFTHTLLQGLKGQADANHDKLVKMLELNSYLFDEMEKLTGGSQTPVLKSPEGLQNFVLTKTE